MRERRESQRNINIPAEFHISVVFLSLLLHVVVSVNGCVNMSATEEGEADRNVGRAAVSER